MAPVMVVTELASIDLDVLLSNELRALVLIVVSLRIIASFPNPVMLLDA